MKTSEKKATGKPKKAASAAKTPKSRKPVTAKSVPTEEEIRDKAMEIYYERIARGEHGTPESDWMEAEELLRGS
jgi:hypothetical protein